MNRILLEAELVAHRRHAQRELWRTLGLPSRWAHRRADTLIDRLDWLDYALGELAREQEAA